MMKKTGGLLVLFCLVLVGPACAVRHDGPGHGHGPPSHAPAHGYRKQQYTYLYFPSVGVYYSPDRGVYFWYESGGWKKGSRPPADLKRTKRVKLHLDTSKPFEKHQKVRKNHGGPGKGKGRGRNGGPPGRGPK